MKPSFHLATPSLLMIVLLLSGCAGPRASDTATSSSEADFARVSSLARAAYDRGSLAQAETLYRQAHRRARALHASVELASASYNLAAVLLANGRTEDARPLLDEAEEESRRAGQTPTDVWLVKAKLEATENHSADALRWIEAVNQSSSASPAQRADAALLHGEIACDRKDVALARAQLEAARKWTSGLNPLQDAGIEKLYGLIALLDSHPTEAAAAFDLEAEYCRNAERQRAMALALARAGDAYATAGDMRSAAERTYRAARSFFAQGDLPAARPLLVRAQQAATLAGDAALTRRVESLTEEIDRTNQ